MQRGGELAGLEGVFSLWGTERTYVIAAPSRGRRSNDSGRLNSGWFIPVQFMALQETRMPPDGQSSRSGDPRRPSGSSEVGRKLGRAGTFTSRVREAGCSVAARDNTHLRGNFARGFVTHLHADAAIIAHMPNNMSKLQWKVWQFFEDPSSSRAVRHLLTLSWRCCSRLPRLHARNEPARPPPPRPPPPHVRLRRSTSPSS